MPDTNTNTTDAQAEAAAAAPGVLTADSEGLLTAVEDRVQERTAAGDVLEGAVEELVEARMDRRTELLRNALEQVKRLNKEERKIKPQPKGYTRDGEAVEGEVYRQDQVNRLKQIADEREPIVKAIAAQDFDELSRLGF